MALTESEKTELKNDILNAIKAESQGVPVHKYAA